MAHSKYAVSTLDDGAGVQDDVETMNEIKPVSMTTGADGVDSSMVAKHDFTGLYSGICVIRSPLQKISINGEKTDFIHVTTCNLHSDLIAKYSEKPSDGRPSNSIIKPAVFASPGHTAHLPGCVNGEDQPDDLDGDNTGLSPVQTFSLHAAVKRKASEDRLECTESTQTVGLVPELCAETVDTRLVEAGLNDRAATERDDTAASPVGYSEATMSTSRTNLASAVEDSGGDPFATRQDAPTRLLAQDNVEQSDAITDHTSITGGADQMPPAPASADAATPVVDAPLVQASSEPSDLLLSASSDPEPTGTDESAKV